MQWKAASSPIISALHLEKLKPLLKNWRVFGSDFLQDSSANQIKGQAIRSSGLIRPQAMSGPRLAEEAADQ